MPLLRAPATSTLLAVVLLASPVLGQLQAGPLRSPTIGPQNTAPFELTGRVLNGRTNGPIHRALVHLGARAVLTNHDGFFSFPQVTNTSATLIASKPGFHSDPYGDDAGPHTFMLTPGTPVDLVLYPEAILAGTVVNSAGEGLPNFMVLIRRSQYDENGHHWSPSGAARTDSNGAFRQTLPAGDYSVQTQSIPESNIDQEVDLPLSVPVNSSSATEALHLKPGEQLQLELKPEFRRAYKVLIATDAEEGRGFPQIKAYMSSGLAIPVSSIPVPGQPGAVRILLPNGTYRLLSTMQTRDGLTEGETSVTVAGHDVPGVVLRSIRVPRIPIEVAVDSGSTSDNLTIPNGRQLGLTLVSNVTTADVTEQSYPAMTDRDQVLAFTVPSGSYQLQSRSAGQWAITGADYGGANLLSEKLVIAPGGSSQPIRIRISNQTGTLTGAITMAGQALPGYVYVVATGPSIAPVVMIHSNSDGSFSRFYIPLGTYHVLATEQRLAADLRDPATMNRYLGKMQSITLTAGGKENLTLEAVSAAELPR